LMPIWLAISFAVGLFPLACSKYCAVRYILRMRSPTYAGNLITRPCWLSARLTLWRIHQVA